MKAETIAFYSHVCAGVFDTDAVLLSNLNPHYVWQVDVV